MGIVAVRPFLFAGREVQPGELVRGADGEQLSAKLFGQLVNRHWVKLVDDDGKDATPNRRGRGS